MFVRVAIVVAGVARSQPGHDGEALAEPMNAEAARRFVAGKLFAYNCFDGTRGPGRIYSDGSVDRHDPASRQWPDALRRGCRRERCGSKAKPICASLAACLFEPCFNLDRTERAQLPRLGRRASACLPIAISTAAMSVAGPGGARTGVRAFDAEPAGPLRLHTTPSSGATDRRDHRLISSSLPRAVRGGETAAAGRSQPIPTSTRPSPMNESARYMPVSPPMSTRNTLTTVRARPRPPRQSARAATAGESHRQQRHAEGEPDRRIGVLLGVGDRPARQHRAVIERAALRARDSSSASATAVTADAGAVGLRARPARWPARVPPPAPPAGVAEQDQVEERAADRLRR